MCCILKQSTMSIIGFENSEYKRREILNMASIKCPECGTEISDDVEKCINCGCPIAKCESIYTKKASKNKMPIVFAIVLLAVAICGYFGVNKYKSYVYQQKLNSIIYIIIDSGAEAEECGNLIHNVWYNAIFYVSNTDTDKYTKTNGCFNDDFNDSLDNLYKSKYFTEKISDIQCDQDKVLSLMKELNNPPPKYKEAYKNLLVLYNEYIDFSNIVINPEGSLQSFTEKFNEKDGSFVNSYDKMKLYID